MFVPNAGAPAQVADVNKPGAMTGWEDVDHELLIEEGRRQVDRQHDDLERIRTRAQVALAFGLALVGTIAALDDRMSAADCSIARVLWILALVAGAWSVLGAAATSVVRADVEVIDATTLSTYNKPIKADLAADYAKIVVTGENQLATRLTNLRHAVMWLLIAAILALLAWITSTQPAEPVAANAPSSLQESLTSCRFSPSGDRSASSAVIDRSSVIPIRLVGIRELGPVLIWAIPGVLRRRAFRPRSVGEVVTYAQQTMATLIRHHA